MTVKSVRKILRPSVFRPHRGGKSGSVISRISSFKPKSLITIGGKRKYRKHSGGKSRKSYRKVRYGGRSKKSYRKIKSGGSKKSYKKTKSGGRRRTKRSKSKRT